MMQIKSMTSTTATELIPTAIPADAAILPIMEGIRIEPKLAVVRMKLQAIGYF